MDPLKSGQPSYNGQTVKPLPVHMFLPPKKGQPLNACPKVSIIQRFHCCVVASLQPLYPDTKVFVHISMVLVSVQVCTYVYPNFITLNAVSYMCAMYDVHA